MAGKVVNQSFRLLSKFVESRQESTLKTAQSHMLEHWQQFEETMKYIFILSGFFSLFGCNNQTSIDRQGFLPMDTLTDYPTEINSKVKGEIERVYYVDFTGDKVKDYIVQTKINKEDKFDEIWLTSDFLLFNQVSKYSTRYNYIRFINIDNDPEPEIYSASGYSDGIDYAFYDLDMKTGKQELLFYFNPVVIDNGEEYWGYPWDTDGIKLQQEVESIKLFYSVDHDIIRDGEITFPEDQNILPIIFLTGHSTQSDIAKIGVEEIRNRSWKTIEEIKKLCTTAHNN